MSEQNEVIEPWNDESNLSMEDRRGSFLKVLCILSWVSIGLSFVTVVFGYIGGREKLLENKSLAEDSLAAMQGDSAMEKFTRDLVLQGNVIIDKTVEYFEQIYIGNFLALVIGGLGVYLMFMLKKTGFYLYLLYVGITLFVSGYYLGMSSIAFDMVFSIAFIVMYSVNLKRMTA